MPPERLAKIELAALPAYLAFLERLGQSLVSEGFDLDPSKPTEVIDGAVRAYAAIRGIDAPQRTRPKGGERPNAGRPRREEPTPEPPKPLRLGRSLEWREGPLLVSVMTTIEARLDLREPWIARCVTHSQMIACDTKKDAIAKAKHRDWCRGCRKADCVDTRPEPRTRKGKQS